MPISRSRDLPVSHPLPRGTRAARLRLEGFVLRFGLFDVPEQAIDLEFAFSVSDRVLEPGPTAAAGGRSEAQSGPPGPSTATASPEGGD